MIEQMKAVYTTNNRVKVAAFVGLLLSAVIFAVLSGGFPPWAWRFLFFSVLPNLSHLMAVQGGGIFLPLLGLVLLSLSLLIVWVVIVTLILKVGSHLWQVYHSRQSFNMDLREAEQLAEQNLAADELGDWFEEAKTQAPTQLQRTPLYASSGATSALHSAQANGRQRREYGNVASAASAASVASNAGVASVASNANAMRTARVSGGPIYPETPTPISNPTLLAPAVVPVARERSGFGNQQRNGQNGEQYAGRPYAPVNKANTAFNAPASPTRNQLRVMPPPNELSPAMNDEREIDDAFSTLFERGHVEQPAQRESGGQPSGRPGPSVSSGPDEPSGRPESSEWLVQPAPPMWLEQLAALGPESEPSPMSSGWLGQLEQLASGRSEPIEQPGPSGQPFVQSGQSGQPSQPEPLALSEQPGQLASPIWSGPSEQPALSGRLGPLEQSLMRQLDQYEQPASLAAPESSEQPESSGWMVQYEHQAAPEWMVQEEQPVTLDISRYPTQPEQSEVEDVPETGMLEPSTQSVRAVSEQISTMYLAEAIPFVNFGLARDADDQSGGSIYDTVPFDESKILKAGPESEVQGMPRLVVGIGLDPGIKRRNAPNEDSIFAIQGMRITDEGSLPAGLFVIADGMGGHANGREASRMAIHTVSDVIVPTLLRDVSGRDAEEEETILQDMLKDGVHRANLSIYRRNRDRTPEMMGTTLTAALIANSTAYVGNVGDSRTYLYRPSEGLKQITRDHSEVARMVESGAITREEIYTHPQRNRIYRCLGERASVDMDLFTVPLLPGDVLVLCSDGLWEMVRDPALEKLIAASAHNPTQMSAILVQAALNHGGLDNISVVVVGFLQAEE